VNYGAKVIIKEQLTSVVKKSDEGWNRSNRVNGKWLIENGYTSNNNRRALI